MATQTLTPLGIPVVLRQQRIIRNHYRCCETWHTDLLMTAADWCPVCDAKIQPHASESFIESRYEFDLT